MYFNPNSAAQEEDEKQKREDFQNKRFFKFILCLFCFACFFVFFLPKYTFFLIESTTLSSALPVSLMLHLWPLPSGICPFLSRCSFLEEKMEEIQSFLARHQDQIRLIICLVLAAGETFSAP